MVGTILWLFSFVNLHVLKYLYLNYYLAYMKILRLSSPILNLLVRLVTNILSRIGINLANFPLMRLFEYFPWKKWFKSFLSKGLRRVQSSYKIQPILQISGSYWKHLFCNMSSGEAYSGVYLQVLTTNSPGGSCLETPKSAILSTSPSKRIFAGFRSL